MEREFLESAVRRTCFVGLVAIALCLFASTSLATDTTSPLADAAKQQDAAAARLLIGQGSDVNAAHVDGMTPLHWSVYHDDLETTKLLVQAGATVDVKNRYGVSPLSIACQNGNAAIVELLLQNGADPNTTLAGGETVLMTAARTGKVGPVNLLLGSGAKLNAKERNGQTAMMWAAADGHVDVVKALIKAGADYHTPLKSGFTPMFFAIREGHTKVALSLAAAGIDVNDVMDPEKAFNNTPDKGTSALILAVENGHLELAAKLLDAGANPNEQRMGFTPLHTITWVRKPIRGDGDPSPIGSGKLSSLDFVRELVKHGADVNARHGKQGAPNGKLNRTDATPLLLASETGDAPLVKLLLELGADASLQNSEHCTPLLAAAGVGILSNGDETAGTEEESIEVIQILLKLGADINAVDDLGNTAMHGAAYKSWTKLVQFLADNGADIIIWNTKNKRRWTPLMIAQGHRPGNFRPSAETIVAVQHVMIAAGVKPPT